MTDQGCSAAYPHEAGGDVDELTPEQEAAHRKVVEQAVPLPDWTPSAASVHADEMGIWSDGGDIVWLPVRHYPSRRGAFRFARDNWQATPSQVYVTHAWMKFQPQEWEERWIECEGDDSGAFACWRLECA